MNDQNVWRLGRRPALDGLRAIAVGLVLIAHSRLPLVGNGGAVGVAIFFTLSGFLITSLLLQEREAFGSFKVGAFYLRRALRLIPAMVACVALAMTISMILWGDIPDWALVIGTLTYTSNWVMAAGAFPAETGLGHTWSLAIEEQFYIVWPILLIVLARLSRIQMIRLLLLACAAVLILRALLWDGGAGEARLYFGSDTRADGLLFGAAAAFALHGVRERDLRPALRWGALAVLGACCFVPGGPKAILMPTIAGIATATLIYALVQGKGFPLLELPFVRWIGNRSYGIYLYQSPIHILILETLGDSPLWWVLIHVPATLIVAEASYRWIETPFLRLKDKGSRSHGQVSDKLEPSRLDVTQP